MEPLRITSWVAGKALSSASEASFPSFFDGRILAKVGQISALETIQALSHGKKALEPWSKTAVPERLRVLEGLKVFFRDNRESVVRTLAEFEGLSLKQADAYLFTPVLDFLDRLLSAGFSERSRQSVLQPTGLVVIIAPSVASFRVIGERLLPALLAGNAVVVKSSARGPAGSHVWRQAFESVGLPDGVLSLLIGSGSEVGDLLSRHPSVHAVSFAGRPETAARVVAASAKMGRKVQISGGVKNSLILHPEIDPAQIPSVIESMVLAAGRWPWGLSRVYLPESRSEELFELIKDGISALEPLTSVDGDSPWTPLPNDFDVPAWEEIRGTAVQDHAHILAGGDGAGSRHLRPLLVRDMTNCSTLQLEELKVPLVILGPVKYAHEMVKWTNTGDFGFCASVWGPSEKAQKIGEKLDVGQVWVNAWLRGPEPFAGRKSSFFGIPDFRPGGDFFSSVKNLTPAGD